MHQEESRTLKVISVLDSLITEINDKASCQCLLATQLQTAANELHSTADFLTNLSKVIIQLQTAVQDLPADSSDDEFRDTVIVAAYPVVPIQANVHPISPVQASAVYPSAETLLFQQLSREEHQAY